MAIEKRLKEPPITQPQRLARLIAMQEEVQDRLSRVEAVSASRRNTGLRRSGARSRSENGEALDRLSESLNAQLTACFAFSAAS